MPGDLQISGLDAFRAKMRRLGDEAKRDLKDMNGNAAKVVEKRAAQIVPRRTGTLQGSIRSSGTLASGKVRAGRAAVPYAGPIHFGWPNRPNVKWAPGVLGGGPIRPQPFLYDAMDDRRRQVLDSYDDDVARLVRKYD